MAVDGPQKFLKLISRKIWMIEKSWNIQTVSPPRAFCPLLPPFSFHFAWSEFVEMRWNKSLWIFSPVVKIHIIIFMTVLPLFSIFGWSAMSLPKRIGPWGPCWLWGVIRNDFWEPPIFDDKVFFFQYLKIAK